ncbi:MAG: DUF1634 domain-containing protein [Bryobacterales bacterium]|nr:DUF1634 domain-containing protein [Bryobacterales bacterium]
MDKERQLEVLISITLRSGVVIAVALGVIGGGMFLWSHATEPMHFVKFLGPVPSYSTLDGVGAELFGSRRGLAIAQVGVLCLLLTPISRVALSIIGFVRERDWIFTVLTTVVLAILMWSLTMG